MKILVTMVGLLALCVPSLQAANSSLTASIERAVAAQVLQKSAQKQNKLLPTPEQRAEFAKHVKGAASNMEANGLEEESMAWGIYMRIHTLYAFEKEAKGEDTELTAVEKRALDYAVFVWFKDEHKHYASQDSEGYAWTNPYPQYYLTKEEDKVEGEFYGEPLPNGSWNEYEKMVQYALEYVAHYVEKLDTDYLNYQHIVLKNLTH